MESDHPKLSQVAFGPRSNSKVSDLVIGGHDMIERPCQAAQENMGISGLFRSRKKKHHSRPEVVNVRRCSMCSTFGASETTECKVASLRLVAFLPLLSDQAVTRQQGGGDVAPKSEGTWAAKTCQNTNSKMEVL